jgi:hypothetical protein
MFDHDAAVADILAGWGLTVDANNFNLFKATVPCPPNTYGKAQRLTAAAQDVLFVVHLMHL